MGRAINGELSVYLRASRIPIAHLEVGVSETRRIRDVFLAQYILNEELFEQSLSIAKLPGFTLSKAIELIQTLRGSSCITSETIDRFLHRDPITSTKFLNELDHRYRAIADILYTDLFPVHGVTDVAILVTLLSFKILVEEAQDLGTSAVCLVGTVTQYCAQSILGSLFAGPVEVVVAFYLSHS